MANNTAKVRIRMYRQGLGDCFLLTFFTEKKPVHILIDCGTLGTFATQVKIIDVVKDIAKETGGRLDLLVVTHEHKDHVSGFKTGRKVFDNLLKIDKVWVAWTENPKDELAAEIQKYKDDLLTSLLFGIHTLSKNSASNPKEKKALFGVASATRELLNFDGNFSGNNIFAADEFAETVHEAMTYASMLAGDLPDFRLPGEVIEPDWLPGWRFYVLGPPRDPQALYIFGDHESPELYHFNKGMAADIASSVQFQVSKRYMAAYQDSLDIAETRQKLEMGLPFEARYRLEGNNPKEYEPLFKSYKRQPWRRIDYDWLASFDDLALQLNNATNNTSLVLAIESIKDKKVLLFPADAQLGNWQSWDKVEFQVTEPSGSTKKVSSRALLKNAVFYKVGHHASHNATRSKNGLEAMKHPDLVAMIPVDQKIAKGKGSGWVMPAEALYDELVRKTRGRVIRSDTGWPNKKPSFWTKQEWNEIKKEWKKFQKKSDSESIGQSTIDIQSLYIDFLLH